MFVVLVCGSAAGADLATLGKLLTPAYTAMNYDGLCQMEPGWRLSRPRGRMGYAINYAEHAKDQTIASLPYNQSVAVLRLAADAARTEARRQLRDKVISEDKATEAIRFGAWCDGYVKGFISAFIARYERDHASILDQLNAAGKEEP
ncbi:MAG: hypothetical protein K2Y27_01450 [Xanthobacteraceae bacterium]|nr:hypothetical protein [Xanthobacteraceae bacterium]